MVKNGSLGIDCMRMFPLCNTQYFILILRNSIPVRPEELEIIEFLGSEDFVE